MYIYIHIIHLYGTPGRKKKYKSSWEKQKPCVELTQNRIMKKIQMETTLVNC